MPDAQEVYFLTPHNPSDGPWPPTWLVKAGDRLRIAYTAYIDACRILEVPVDELKIAQQLVVGGDLVGGFQAWESDAILSRHPIFGPMMWAAGRLDAAAEAYLEQCQDRGVPLRPVDFVLRLVSGKDLAAEYSLATAPGLHPPGHSLPPPQQVAGASHSSASMPEASDAAAASALPRQAPVPSPISTIRMAGSSTTGAIRPSPLSQLASAPSPSSGSRRKIILSTPNPQLSAPSQTVSGTATPDSEDRQLRRTSESPPGLSQKLPSPKRRRLTKKTNKGQQGRASTSLSAMLDTADEEEDDNDDDSEYVEYRGEQRAEGGPLLENRALRSRPRRVATPLPQGTDDEDEDEDEDDNREEEQPQAGGLVFVQGSDEEEGRGTEQQAGAAPHLRAQTTTSSFIEVLLSPPRSNYHEQLH
ncbi:unnamed protein product [Tilletia controversa]|nr:unnamed protein product [Tilletia controversa]